MDFTRVDWDLLVQNGETFFDYLMTETARLLTTHQATDIVTFLHSVYGELRTRVESHQWFYFMRAYYVYREYMSEKSGVSHNFQPELLYIPLEIRQETDMSVDTYSALSEDGSGMHTD